MFIETISIFLNFLPQKKKNKYLFRIQKTRNEEEKGTNLMNELLINIPRFDLLLGRILLAFLHRILFFEKQLRISFA